MIGTHPTVGCLILLEKASFTSVEDVLQSLGAVIPIRERSRPNTAPLGGEATLGGGMHPMIAWAEDVGDMAAVHLDFDEDEVMRVGQAARLSVEQLFMPYVQAAKTIPGVLAIGVGFEVSSPADLRQSSLQEAGAAVVFARDEKHKSWLRQENLPLAGHHS